MRAITIDAPGAPPAPRDDLPDPAPAEREVLVHVHTSSVNPVDNAIAAGMLTGMAEHEYPVILGRDYAGVVEQVGTGVSGYAVGDAVYGFVLHADPAVHAGAWADLISVSEDISIAPAPVRVDFAIAGAAPLAGITALTAVDALDLSAGDVALIVGATGGVGSLAVQLAVRAGAHVVAPGLPEDEDYLRDLGVSDMVPRDGDIAELVRGRHAAGVDALLDLVSYAPGAFDAALGAGARVVSPIGAAGDGPDRSNVMARPTKENLLRLGALLADRSLRVPIHATFDLAQAPEALRVLAGEHTQGKLALRFA